MPDMIVPDWPAPARIRSLSTTRAGGVSTGPWSSLNLGFDTGDESAAVAENRRRLRSRLPCEPYWLRQVHGDRVVSHGSAGSGPRADAVTSTGRGEVCAVLTADCLPVLFCDLDASCVAAAHAGWRGLAAGVLEATVAALGRPPENLLAWLGPCIGPAAYEIGNEVRDVFVEADSATAGCFSPRNGRWLADLRALARLRLGKAGVDAVFGCGSCTFSQPERFYSYRRDGVTGRMASLIWVN